MDVSSAWVAAAIGSPLVAWACAGPIRSVTGVERRQEATASGSAAAVDPAPAPSTAVAPPKPHGAGLQLRPEWTAQLSMRNPVHDVPSGVDHVVVHVPENFDAAGPLHLVVFLHGAVQCAAELALIGKARCRE